MEFYQFHPPASPDWEVLLTEGLAVRAASCATWTRRGSWSATPPPSRTWRHATWWPARWCRRSGRAAGRAQRRLRLPRPDPPPPRSQIEAKLPDITEFARTYLGVDPVTELVPVLPTAHYAMGGIPTDIETRVLRNNEDVVPGLFAAGEVACVSYTGRTGWAPTRCSTSTFSDGGPVSRPAPTRWRPTSRRYRRIPRTRRGHGRQPRDGDGGERVGVLRTEMQATMDMNAQVYRTEATLKQALSDVQELRRRYQNVSIMDKGQRYNTDLLEPSNSASFDLAEVLVVSALARKESRGGHAREDYQTRDDVNFMRHTMAYRNTESGGDATWSYSTTSP